MSTQLGKHLCFIFNVYFFSLVTRWSTKLNLTKVNYFLSEFWLFWSKVLRVKQVCVSTMLRLHICLCILGTPMAWSQFNKMVELTSCKAFMLFCTHFYNNIESFWTPALLKFFLEYNYCVFQGAKKVSFTA